jgi:crotonobetainyl-CoA:carnitine CoA-transferase CaiB-like acyl-CoA transferase
MPLAGIRVLALEQMQALPFATQLLARLGADVVKVEPPTGELGRSSTPVIQDPLGRQVGATFLRNNLNKRSICIDLKHPPGRDLVRRLAPHFQVVAENSRPGTMERLGLSFEDIRAVHPRVVYVSVSGFGNLGDSPYRSRPAFASIVEAMSGAYELQRRPDEPPVGSPVGALGDISAAMFATVGILAALRTLEQSGQGQYVDVAMYDSVVAFTDIIMNFWSLGLRDGKNADVINHGFRANDGWFMIQIGREAHFARLAQLIGRPEWVTDPRLDTRAGWITHLDSVIRPAVEDWARDKTRLVACDWLGKVGIAAGPCLRAEEVVGDPHLVGRHMISAQERLDGVDQPVLVPGNPVKLSGVSEHPDQRVPWLGEHTDSVLERELGLNTSEIRDLRHQGVIA